MTDRCVACGGSDFNDVRPYRTKTAHGEAIFAEARLLECLKCALVQAVPAPALGSLEDYYAIDYRKGCFAGADVADLASFPKDNLFYYNRGQSIADLVVEHLQVEAPRILDIGAGYGHILYALGERYPNSQRAAIEFSEVCVAHLQSLGIQVYAKAAEEVLSQIPDQFDLIVLSHVLEHLLEPTAMLQLIRDRLAPGGLLYIEVPHIPEDSLRGYIDSVWAPRFDEPHITFFSPPTLQTLLTASDFGVLFCNTAGLEYKRISALQFHMPHWRWFLQRLMPDSLFHFLRSRNITESLKVKEREDSFYTYGGYRIWI